MRIKSEILPLGFQKNEKDKKYVELNEENEILSAGVYRDEMPVGWVLKLEEKIEDSQVVKSEIIRFKDVVDEGIEYSEWVKNWLSIIDKEGDDFLNFVQRCDFCKKSSREVEKIIAGPTTYICNECVELCNTILES